MIFIIAISPRFIILHVVDSPQFHALVVVGIKYFDIFFFSACIQPLFLAFQGSRPALVVQAWSSHGVNIDSHRGYLWDRLVVP